MKKIYFFFFLSLTSTSLLLAQTETDIVSQAADYADFVYYNLADGDKTNHQHDAWDIAFDLEFISSGVLVNEGSPRVPFGSTAAEVTLFSVAGDYENVDTSDLTRLYNPNTTWGTGAFNTVNDPNNVFDQGWGIYNVSNNNVYGSRPFVIQLRSGDFKKMQIDSLVGGLTYYFKYADLDGSNEQTVSFSKTEYTGNNLAYFSFAAGDMVDLEPDNWDMLFTRYLSPINYGGAIVYYPVTGILSRSGIEVAQADGVDVTNVDYMDYTSVLTDSIDAFGSDWKTLDGFSFIITPNRTYFVKTANEEIWQVTFVNFTGASFGETTLERTFIMTTSTEDVFAGMNSFNVFPNPVQAGTPINVSMELDQSFRQTSVRLTNSLGQVVYERQIDTHSGFQVNQVPTNQLPGGIYYLSLTTEGNQITRPVQIK